jgi:trehalose/maltose hydrolase-like predicted phosphorylase
MTDEQRKQQIAQIEQDNITLDYTKWSEQRRNAKLSNDHNLWQFERDRTLARQRSDNAEARARHLNKIEAERKAKQTEADAQTEIQLQPEKRRLQNEWLANNPTQPPADFEKKAWHLLKENLIEQHNAASLEAEKQRQMKTGGYSL